MREEINGDIRLSLSDRLRYLWRNMLLNFAAIGRGPTTRAFRIGPQDVKGRIFGQSPSRLLTELFIERELPQLLAPGEITVFEIGCGSGSLVRRLAAIGYRGQYIGVDITDRFRHDEVSGFPFRVTFVHRDVHTVTPELPVDLVVSISAIEHIPRDGKLLRQLASVVRPGGLELHVVPAAAGLIAYLWHGFRQYTPRSIAARFGTAGVELVRLGGLGTLAVHVLTITIPELLFHRSLRQSAPALYASLMRAGLTLDRLLPIAPTAIVIVRRH